MHPLLPALRKRLAPAGAVCAVCFWSWLRGCGAVCPSDLAGACCTRLKWHGRKPPPKCQLGEGLGQSTREWCEVVTSALPSYMRALPSAEMVNCFCHCTVNPIRQLNVIDKSFLLPSFAFFLSCLVLLFGYQQQQKQLCQCCCSSGAGPGASGWPGGRAGGIWWL